jgi:hypothetical protein
MGIHRRQEILYPLWLWEKEVFPFYHWSKSLSCHRWCYCRCCHSAIKIAIVERVSTSPPQSNCEAWIQRKEQVSMYRHVKWWWSYVLFSFGAWIRGRTNYHFVITESDDVWIYGLIFLFRVWIDPSDASGSVPNLEQSSLPRSVSSLKPSLSPSGFPSSNQSVDPIGKPSSVLSLESSLVPNWWSKISTIRKYRWRT